MDTFWDQEYYKLNKIQMSHFGMWPGQTIFRRIALNVFHVFNLGVVLICQVRGMLEKRHDQLHVVECLPPPMTVCVGLVKLLNANVNVDKANKLLAQIQEDWKRYTTSPNVDILHKYAKRGRMLTIFYGVYTYSSLTVYLCLPFTSIVLDVIQPLNESRPKRLIYMANYGIDEQKYFWAIDFHMCITSYILMAMFVTNESMYFTFVEHVCGLFEMVGANMNLMKDPENDHFKDNNKKRISYCVQLHREALSFAELIESNYSGMFTFIMAFCMVAMSITLVQMAFSVNRLEEMFRHLLFILGQMSHLFFISNPGQLIINYSLKVHDDVYAADWIDFDIKTQRLVIFLLMRSQKACQISAAKIYVLSMESYSRVVQTAMSYFTVLTSMM